MNKQEALEQLREHLSDAPNELKEYVLKSWYNQAKDIKNDWWSSTFFMKGESIEGLNFWDFIYYQQWNKAIEIANENNWWKVMDSPKEYEFLELRKAAERNAKQIKRITECIEKVADILEKLNASKPTEPKKEDNDWLNPPLKVGDRVFIFEIWVGDCRLPKYENKVYKIESVDFKGNCIYKTKNGVIFCDREGNKDKWVKIA